MEVSELHPTLLLGAVFVSALSKAQFVESRADVGMSSMVPGIDVPAIVVLLWGRFHLKSLPEGVEDEAGQEQKTTKGFEPFGHVGSPLAHQATSPSDLP